MSDKEIKQMYDDMKKSGDLLDMHPDLRGSWDKDKTLFKTLYINNEDLINDLDPIDIDNEY